MLQEFILDYITRFIVSLLEEVRKLNSSFSEHSKYLSLDRLLVFIELMENIFTKSRIVHVWHQ
jgi:hypothetical protein